MELQNLDTAWKYFQDNSVRQMSPYRLSKPFNINTEYIKDSVS